MQWYPRDEAGAYNRQTVEGVPDAWAEGMVSLIQLTLYERGMTGEDRGTIKQYMFRCAVGSPLLHMRFISSDKTGCHAILSCAPYTALSRTCRLAKG